MESAVSTRFFGLFSRRYRWGLSIRGLIVVGLVSATMSVILWFELYPFLSVNRPVPSDTLVVEGWVSDYAIRQAAVEYMRGHYRYLFTTGGPVVGKGGYINDYWTSASVGAELLKKIGIRPEAVQMVPSRVIGRDRTYSSAVALREWLTLHNISIKSLNILTEDAHARRTRLLFQEALGPKINVGVIAVRSPNYEANHWWHYSDGVREVIGEAIAYLYARFIFRPSAH